MLFLSLSSHGTETYLLVFLLREITQPDFRCSSMRSFEYAISIEENNEMESKFRGNFRQSANFLSGQLNINSSICNVYRSLTLSYHYIPFMRGKIVRKESKTCIVVAYKSTCSRSISRIASSLISSVYSCSPERC